MKIIIAGIHTGIGKTICSAILADALGYDYWKPIQAGDLDNSDSIFVKNNIYNTHCMIHPEAFRLSLAASPHWAALYDGVSIQKENIIIPATQNGLIIETAGGVMSPLSDDLLNIDLIQYFNLPVILISNNYLGSINHTLLTVSALQHKNIAIMGIVFSGEEVKSSEDYIIQQTKLKHLFSIPKFDTIDKNTITNFAKTITNQLQQFIL
ncbi:MAG: dethiobiotin synthase [Bacteroidota bacterium]|nr:dethiobiotin synthase [Bacteroidota bacterium]